MIGYFVPKYKGVTNVEANFKNYFKLLTNKCLSIFKWDGLPDTIDERFLTMNLVLSGKVVWFKDGDKLYALNSNEGGKPNAYYEPTIAIVANPVVGSKQIKIRNEDGSNDVESLDGILMALTDVDYEADLGVHGGLYSTIYKYAGLLADNDVSINCSQLNGRVSIIYTADDEAQARAGELILKEIYEGKPYKIVKQDLVNKFGTNPVASSGQNNTIISLIETHAYLLQNFYSEIGIASQGNMKRERVNTAETELMTGCLDINIYNMIKNLRNAVELINKKFDVSISVKLNDEVFYDGSQNATLGDVELDKVGDPTDADGELQVDGVVEDKIKKPKPGSKPEPKSEPEQSKEGDDNDKDN